MIISKPDISIISSLIAEKGHTYLFVQHSIRILGIVLYRNWKQEVDSKGELYEQGEWKGKWECPGTAMYSENAEASLLPLKSRKKKAHRSSVQAG